MSPYVAFFLGAFIVLFVIGIAYLLSTRVPAVSNVYKAVFCSAAI